MSDILRYPNDLLKIETGQQFRQLCIFDENGSLRSEFTSLNSAVSQVIKLNEGDQRFSILFPSDISDKIPDKVKKQISTEISASELRVLTAVLSFAQRAGAMGALHYIDKINRAYFEFIFTNSRGLPKIKMALTISIKKKS